MECLFYLSLLNECAPSPPDAAADDDDIAPAANWLTASRPQFAEAS